MMRSQRFVIYINLIILISTLIFAIECPDKHRECDNDSTCCELKSGEYGCCPLPNAQCCTDGIHCCPSGTKCNDKEGTCDEPPPMVTHHKVPLQLHRLLSPNKICPDHKENCSSVETCCKTRSGSYGCCPYESGVCCNDGRHCCPNGTKCDVIHQQCIRRVKYDRNNYYANVKLTFEKMKVIESKWNDWVKSNVSTIICPGGEFQCPDHNTCCKIGAEEWGCCPIEQAVCCDDQIHCCPHSTKCTVTGCQHV